MSASPEELEEEIQRKRLARITAFERALRHFQQGHPGIAIAPLAHKDLSNVYWTLHEKDIRPHVRPKYSGRFKIASLTEKAIFLVQPFRNPDGSPSRESNALFAFASAFSIIMEMDEGEINPDSAWSFMTAKGTSAEQLEALSKDAKGYYGLFKTSVERSIAHHKLWLETHERGDGAFPVFQNAAFLDILWHGMQLSITE